MSALGRYILCGCLFLSASLLSCVAAMGLGSPASWVAGGLAFFTYTGAFRALGYAMHAENENLKKD